MYKVLILVIGVVQSENNLSKSNKINMIVI